MLITALVLGLFLGMQHALEPDHVAAVASMIAKETSRRSIIRHGLAWGIGHAGTMIVVAMVIFSLGLTFSERLSQWLELGVGVMLVGLGAHLLWRLRRDRWHAHQHAHGDKRHLHFHSHRGDVDNHSVSRHQHGHFTLPGRALAVGVMHGMAGSAALVMIAASAYGSAMTAVAFVTVFGLGTVVGMTLLTASIALPVVWSARSLTLMHHLSQIIIGLVTAGIGATAIYHNLLLVTGVP